ncbi:MAG: hypothetical protein Q9216_001553 [Gyalolechia sp. 2 TL-2023]
MGYITPVLPGGETFSVLLASPMECCIVASKGLPLFYSDTKMKSREDARTKNRESAMDAQHYDEYGRRQDSLLLPLSTQDETKNEEQTTKHGGVWSHPALYVVYVKRLLESMRDIGTAPIAVFLALCSLRLSTFTFRTTCNLLVIACGIILASVGEIKFQVNGFMYQMGAIVFEAYRLALTQKILSDEKYKMDPLVSLYYFAPCSAGMIAAMGVLGEWRTIRWETLGEVGWWVWLANGIVAMGLNVAGVFLIGKTSSLVLTLCGVLKNIFIIGASMVVWDTVVTPMQIMGNGIAMAGLVQYNLGGKKVQDMYKDSRSRCSEFWQRRSTSGKAVLVAGMALGCTGVMVTVAAKYGLHLDMKEYLGHALVPPCIITETDTPIPQDAITRSVTVEVAMKRKLGALEKVDADLSYKEDFASQYSQYEAQREIFLQAPASATDAGIISFRDLIDFVSHVADCYPTPTSPFPEDLIHILNLHHEHLEPELREKIVGSLVLLRRKDILDSPTLLQTLFPLLISTHSKSLRALLYQKCLSDIRTSNSKTTNHRLNRTFQTVLYNLLTSDRTSSKGLWAVKITRELWKRQIWTDSKAVEIMKEASLADNEKVVGGGVRFFLGGDKEREELDDESSDEDAIDMGKLKHQAGINKKTKKKARQMKNAVATVKRKERKKKQPHPLNFSAFHLLHDPQGFAETLFSKHLQNSKSKLNLEQKLLVLQLVTRLIGLHKLTIMGLYSYFIKYLTPRQPSVTSFLASLAQAAHNLVPPDVLEPLVQKIANEFVSEAAAAEVASAGLNAIREICVRQPLAMNDTLLQDLVMYRKSKDKGVVMAAKGLLGLYREVGPEMLNKRDRGKDAAMGLKSGERKERRFGEEAVGNIEGLELLEKWKQEEKQRKLLNHKSLDETEGVQAILGNGDDEDDEDDEDDDAWEVDEDSDSDSGGWQNVSSDDDAGACEDNDKRSPKKTKHDDLASGGDAGEIDEEDKENILDQQAESAEKISTLATTRILTPADLAKLQELRLAASVNNALPSSQRKRAAVAHEATVNRHRDDPLTTAEIEGLASLSKKSTKEERVAAAKEGKGDRDEVRKSTTARRKEQKREQGKSTTNREKARKKNFLMTLGKAKGKQKRSLVDRGKVLKAHKERGKRGGKRGNRG